MEAASVAIMVLGYATGGLLLAQGVRRKLFARFPFFYSYATYTLATFLIVYTLRWVLPGIYTKAFWWGFLVKVLAEFAVIVEISDHVFDPYPAIRGLGRVLVASVTAILFVVNVLPSLASYSSPSAFLLGFMKKTFTLKVLALLAVLGVARRYRLNFGRNISGMALGFSVYLGVDLANFTLAETYGPNVYGAAFRFVGPLGFTLALVIWTVALWSYQPAAPVVEELRAAEGERSGALSYELDRMNNALTRLLRG